ncbi:MAG: restriction endonuclease subunit S [Crocosphaera sp.]
MMKKQQYLYKLEDLGYFRSGYSARKKAEIVDAQVATHRLLPIRAMPEVNPYHIDWSRLDPIIFSEEEAKYLQYLLKDGDVIIPVRGLNMKAVYVDNPPDNVLIFNNLAIFSPNKIATGKYIVWWFNHSQTQQQLKRLVMGSSQIFVPMSKLRQLKVPVPTFEIQQKIIDLEALHWQEKELYQKLETKREQLYEALTMKIIESHS